MKQLFPTILIVFVILTILTFPTITRKNTLRTNYEIERQSYPNHTIYLLNKDNYLVEVEVMISENDIVKNIIEYLKENNKKSSPWRGYIPNDVEIIDYQLKNGLLEIHFSEQIKKMKKEYLSGIIASLKKQKNIEEVNIHVEQDLITNIPSMNLETDYQNRMNQEKIVMFYIENNRTDHLVPVSRYYQVTEDKMSTILDELKNNIPNKLISYISDQLKINDYQIENDVMIIDCNKALVEDPEKRGIILKEIAYTMMENYDVNAVLFKVNGKNEELVLKNN